MQEIRPYSYDSNDWQKELDPAEVSALLEELKNLSAQHQLEIYKVLLPELSQFAVSMLTTIESGAFQQPMGHSLPRLWGQGKEHRLFISQKNEAVGFIVLDEELLDHGITYLDLAAVFPADQGVGKSLLSSALQHILESEHTQPKILLARTQNPAMAMSIRSALHQVGKDCFPVDRLPTEAEQQALHVWVKSSSVRTLGDQTPEVDTQHGIFPAAYTRWKPHPTEVKPGPFLEYLQREQIDFAEFVRLGNAFMVGGTLG